jgi:hypothetical protein
MIRVVVACVGDHVDIDGVTNLCTAIARLEGASFPTAIFISGKGVQITFMTMYKDVAMMKLRSMGQTPIIPSSENYYATEKQRKCPNCGWIVSNLDCMRCGK